MTGPGAAGGLGHPGSGGTEGHESDTGTDRGGTALLPPLCYLRFLLFNDLFGTSSVSALVSFAIFCSNSVMPIFQANRL